MAQARAATPPGTLSLNHEESVSEETGVGSPTKAIAGALSTEQIAQFQALYRERFGIELADNDAIEQATRLVRLLRVVGKEYAKHTQKTGEK